MTSAQMRRAAAPFEVLHPAFADVLGEQPRVVLLALTDAHEGPVWSQEHDALFFTSLPARGPGQDSPHVAVKRLALHGALDRLDGGNGRPVLGPERVAVVRAPANVANGMAAAPDGRLVVCEQGSRAEPARIVVLDPRTGDTETLVDEWEGLPLNSPNDVVVAADGAVWFTDPSYGYLQGFRPEPRAGDHVYRWDPGTGRVTVVADTFDKPNGLAFSPDGRRLYVADSGVNQEPGSHHVGRPHHVVAYDVVAGRQLRHERLFAVVTPGFPDGLKVDAAGRVYASSASGVQVFDPDGERLGVIRIPGAVNFTFAGPEHSVLLVTADTAVWAVHLAPFAS